MGHVRVLHLLATGESDAAAVGRVVGELARLSDRTRYAYSAWFLGVDGPLRAELEACGVEVARRPFAGWRDVSVALSFLTALRRGRFDVVHCHTGGRSVRWLARFGTASAVVVHVHGAASEATLPVPERVATDGAHVVIANSAATARRVRARDVRVVHLGVRLPDVPSDSGRPEAAGVVGAASRLAPVKGVGHLIRAFAAVRRRCPEATLEVAGDGPERESLEAEARRLDLTDAVRFLGWQRDVSLLFSRWRVFVQPSIAEGLGLAALEAMAAGLPVVATDAGGLPEVVVDGVTGRVVPVGDEARLADVVSALLDDPALASRMGMAGRERVAEHFSVERMVEGIVAVYGDLVAARARPGTTRRS